MAWPSFAPRVEIRVLDSRLEAWGLPCPHSAQAAGVDLRACLTEPLSLRCGDPAALIPVGFAMHINDSHIAAVILPRSGAGHHRGLVLGNLVGLVDSDFPGPVMVSAWNRNAPGTSPITIKPGERIAQMVFLPVLRPVFEVVAEFSAASKRGPGGFGSTGTGA